MVGSSSSNIREGCKGEASWSRDESRLGRARSAYPARMVIETLDVIEFDPDLEEDE
jgi:hypothetical protein